MVRIIELRSSVSSQPVIEVDVFMDTSGTVAATIDIYSYREQRRVGPAEYPDAMPPAEAYLTAIAYAERRGIPYLCVRDPKGLFPKHLRHDRNI